MPKYPDGAVEHWFAMHQYQTQEGNYRQLSQKGMRKDKK